MGAQSDVRQGRAYVELYVKNSALVRGLGDAKRRLTEFGAGIATIGKWMMVLGLAVVAPIAAMVGRFESVGSALNDMSLRTGMSTEALSELSYAASQTGAEIGDVEKAVRKMQKAIADAASGGKAGEEALAAIGLTAADLIGLSPEHQFDLVAEKMGKIADPTMRAAAALTLFGKSGTALLPMIADLEALRTRARELGLVIGKEDAAAADALGDALGDLKLTIFSAGNGLSAALAPALTNFVLAAANAVLQVKRWAAENANLIGTVLKMSVGVAAAGAAIYVFGKIVVGVGAVLGGMRAFILWTAGGFEILRLAFHAVLVPFALVGAAGRLLVGVFSALRLGAIVAGAAHLAFSVVTTAMSAVMAIGRLAIIGIVSACRFVATGVGVASDAIAVFSRAVGIATTIGLRAFEIAALSVGVAVDIGIKAVSGLVTVISALPTLFSSAVTGVSFLVDAFGVLGSVAKIAQYAITTVGAAIASVAQAGFAMMNLVTIITTIGTALAAVIGLAIVFVGPIMLIREAVQSLVSMFGNMASAVAGGMKSAASAAAAGTQALGSAIVSGTRSAIDGLVSIFSSIASMASSAFDSAVTSFLAAWGTLQADIEAGWSAISAAISAGDLKSAVKVALAGAMLEWERFRAWMETMWATLRPTWNAAVTTAASSIGTLFANAEIAWGDLWDAVQNGVRATLKIIDTMIDALMPKLAAIGAFIGDEINYNRGAPLQMLVPPSRTPEEKAAQDKAAVERGKGIAGSVAGTLTSPEKPVDKAASDVRIKAAEDNFRQAQDDAKKAAADATSAQEARRKAAAAAAFSKMGGADPEAMAAKATVSTSTAGTFNARAAAQMGGGGIQERILSEAKAAKMQREKANKISQDMLNEYRATKFAFTA
jgi:hypothetical protein